MIQKWSEEIKKSETLKFNKDVMGAYGQEFFFKLILPARYLSLWMKLKTNCLLISARFKLSAKERCANEDRYSEPLCRAK